MLLRAIRFYEFEAAGRETWWDEEYEEICTLETLDPDRLPPLNPKFIGQVCDPREIICQGGDYDCRLVVVLEGTVEKLVGGSSTGGRCVTRRLTPGMCEGLPEFLGVGGTLQRTCVLRATAEVARVRFVTKDAVQSLLKQTLPAEEEGDDPILRWPKEVAYFQTLALDRIDALHHKASRELLYWQPTNGTDRLDFMTLDGQNMFRMDNALGMSVSGPLPEGLEERYFLDGQIVIRPEVAGDCLIMILRGEVEADVPDGCGGQCLPRTYKPSVNDGSSWLGNGLCPSPAPAKERKESLQAVNPQEPDQLARLLALRDELAAPKQIIFCALVKPTDIKRAKRKLLQASEAKQLDLSKHVTTDWRWGWDDPEGLKAIDILKSWRLLSEYGEKVAEEVRLHQHPPKPPPPPEPEAVLGSGTMIGNLALIGVRVVFSGVVRARGPVHLAILHRHVLLEAIQDCPERALFVPEGISMDQAIDILSTPIPRQGDHGARPAHLGPNTGPPKRSKGMSGQPLAGTYAAWSAKKGPYAGIPGADALQHVMLNAIKSYILLWNLLYDAAPRLLEAVYQQFEPRFLLPGETVIVDEEPDADFLFIVIHGQFVVSLEGAEIAHIAQGDIQGAAQLLTLNDWTRTVRVDRANRGEAMIYVLRRSKLVEVLAGHPAPKQRLREVEEELRDAKLADWKLFRQIPAFAGCAYKPFLARLFKDADICLFCPGDFLAEVDKTASSMIVILAGEVRCEQPQTLFYVELKRGDWCFQNNILGIQPDREHDVVAVTHVMCMYLYRHALLNAIVAHPQAREAVTENETWRSDESVPRLEKLCVFIGVPEPVLRRLEADSEPKFYKTGSILLALGAAVEEDMLLFILRGEVKVSILGIQTRTMGVGATIGVHRYFGLDCPPGQIEIVATAPCDVMALKRETMAWALEEEKFEDDLMPYKNGRSILAGGQILDAFGFPIGSAKYAPNCIEESEVFRACSEQFVAQMPKLVEEMVFWPKEKLYSQGDPGDYMYFIKAGRVRLEALGRKQHEVLGGGATIGEMACLDQVPSHVETCFAETHVWVRALHKKLLRRVLSSFPEEERRLMGKASGGKGLFD